MLTYTLRAGLVVLAKLYKGQPSPYTFANRTQAAAAAAKVGGTVHGFTRPWVVAVPTQDG